MNQQCRSALISQLRIAPQDVMLGMSRPDPLLGYVPKEGFHATINAYGWPRVSITIDDQGFRHPHRTAPIGPRILAVGDSFTFGDQVSDEQTWPACLEERLGRPVDNAGVFGYGAAQSMRRAQLVMERGHAYDTLILSVMVGNDFDRDRLSYRSGFPRPALIITDKGADFAAIPSPSPPGTKFNPRPLDTREVWVGGLMSHSLAVFEIIKGLGIRHDFTGMRLNEVHLQAATKPQAIDWTLRTLASLPVARRLLLLQYGHDLYENINTQEERKMLTSVANDLSIPVVDTFEAFQQESPQTYWNSHHTPYGNQVVCGIVIDALRH
jgi:hypothetical protein